MITSTDRRLPPAGRTRAALFCTLCVLGVGGLLTVWVSAQPASTGRIRGFSAQGSTEQTALEERFKGMLTTGPAEADFDVMTAEPHHAGSPYQIKLAEYVANQFRQFGFETSMDEYSVLLPWPGERRIEIVAPDRLALQVEEET